MSISPAKVAVSDTLRTSKSVCPSTSKSPLASILEENVDTPDTLKSSKSVLPSTSKSPLASILPVNVDTPVTLKFLVTSCSITPLILVIPIPKLSLDRTVVPSIL